MPKQRSKIARNSSKNGGRKSAKLVGQKSKSTGPLPGFKAKSGLRKGRN